MNAQQCPLKEFLQGEKIFQLPVYQRNYAWHECHVVRFLDDIEQLIRGRKNHFLGVIVYVTDRIPTSPAQRTIIDGQQRLATAMIFLQALRDADESLADRISRSYLQNEFITGVNNIKLHLVEQDQQNFVALINNSGKCDRLSRIWDAYNLCKKRIADWIASGKFAEEILAAFEKIQIVYLQLLADEDEPQLIFESINATGLDLSTADLIRNFLLMDVRDPVEQLRLFKTYWIPIAEKNLHRDNNKLNDFFMHFVTFKRESLDISKERLYDAFKDLCEDQDRERILVELEKFSEYFEAFVFPTEKYSAPIQKSLLALMKLKQTTCFPFLFHLFDDFANQIIDETTLEKVLHLIVSYYVQVIVCGIATSSRRELFVKLYSRAFAVESNRQKYFETIKKYICTQNSMREKMPSPELFFSSLTEIKLLNNRTLCRFILEDLAGIDSDRLKVITIMPEIFSKKWNSELPRGKKISTEEHERIRYTLGNLTLAEKDLPLATFEEKKELLKYSPARELNRDVLDKDSWSVMEIDERSWQLARILSDRYGIDQNFDPSITFDPSVKILPNITLEDWNESITGRLLGYSFESSMHEIKTWREMFEEILKLLDEKNPSILVNMASQPDSEKMFPISTKHFLGSSRIREGIFVQTDFDTKGFVETLRKLLPMYELPNDSISFVIVEE